MSKSLLAGALGLLSFFGIFSVAHAETFVSGPLSGDTTWTLAESPYVVTGDIEVPAGVTLTVEPGVVVKPMSERFVIVNGTILADGTESSPIFFTSIKDDAVGGDTNGDGSLTSPTARNWRHILMTSGSVGTFRYVTVRYGGAYDDPVPLTGIKNDGGALTLDHITLTDNGYDGFSQTAGSSVITHSYFARHDIGITLYGGVTTIENSIIDENWTGLGIYGWLGSPVVSVSSSTFTNNQYGMDLGVSDVTITNSRIVGNHTAAIYSFTDPLVDVRGNWWGNASGPTHENNPGGTGGEIFGDALYTPWLISDPEATPNTIISTLSFATATPKGLWENDGIQDAKGTASSTVFTFSTIYTHSGNLSPENVTLHAYNPNVSDFYDILMTVDSTATTTLRDGDYRNGEQYCATSTFPKAEYKYFFTTKVGSTSISMPTSTTELGFKTGYSNVAFLPGHQASRLYQTAAGNDENQIWDPEFIHDNGDLYLNPDGASKEPDIYVKTTPNKGVIDEAYGANVYKNFLTYMDTEVVGAGLINEWGVIPYDWRLDFATLMETGKRDGDKVSYINGTTSTPFILEELRRLASTSDTGKVSIITHSNGGLLAKYILATLGASADPLVGEVDKLIMVAPPQLGTPTAVAGLLHGDEIGIAKGFILRKSTARQLGENMISAYNLLPSEKYFNIVSDPVISFDQSVSTISEIGDLAGTSITSEIDMHSFLMGRKGLWTEPNAGDTDVPNVLKDTLLARSTSTHALIDAWIPPQEMQVIQIAGWGFDTPKSMRYDACDIPFCSNTLATLDREVIFTFDGDGTVVVPSALAIATSTANIERWWVNIEKHNNQNLLSRRNRSHADILEIEELQDFIRSVLGGNNTIANGSIVVDAKPLVDEENDRLRFQLHSPVSMHLYDGYGNHTGIVGSSSDMIFVEQNVPNSYYFEFGEAKYAGMSKGASTTVTLKGEALGSFTFDIEEVTGETTTATTSFVDIPVTASTTVSVVLPTDVSSLSQLLVDVDGDGTVDTTLESGAEGVTAEQLTAILKGIVKTFDLPTKKKANLIKKIEKLEKELAKEHKNKKVERLKTKHAFGVVTEAIKRFQKKGVLTADEATELLEIVGQIKGAVIH